MLRKSFLLFLVILMTQVVDRHGQVKTITVSGPPHLQFPFADEVLSNQGAVRRAAFSANAKTYDQLRQLVPPIRYSGNPILVHGGGGWKNAQIQEPVIVVDPTDSTRLIMFFSGMDGTPPYGTIRIGRATASLNNPHVWTEYVGNPIINVGSPGAWDDAYIRLDSVFYNPDDNLFWLYYTGHGASTTIDQIGLARSSNGITFTKYAGNPILSPSGSETWVSQGTVLKEGSVWRMYYNWRGATILQSIKLATSNDGITWTKTGVSVWSCGAPGSYDSTYIEWQQVFKLDGKYVFIASVYDGTYWSIGMAYSTAYDAVVTKEQNPIFQRSGQAGSFDQYHVATATIYDLNQKWYLYYQGGNNATYGISNWDMGAADLK